MAGGRSSSAGDVRRRHAEHFTDATRLIDAQIRTADEARGRRRLDEIVAEVRAAHRWARRHHPSLASAMSGALHLRPTRRSGTSRRSGVVHCWPNTPLVVRTRCRELASWLPVRMRTAGSSPTPDQLQRLCRSRPRQRMSALLPWRSCPTWRSTTASSRRSLASPISFGGWVSSSATGMRS